MGAIWFENSIEEKDAKTGYQRLYEQATTEYGNDPYNGTIATTYGFKIIKKYQNYSDDEKRKKEIENLVAKFQDKAEKYCAYCIDLGVIEYIRVSYKKENKKTNAKYKLGFMLKKANQGYFDELAFKETKKELDKIVEQELKKDSNARLVITKEYKLLSGNNTATEIMLKKESFKKEPKYKKDTIMIEAIHKYLFVGFAGY